MRQGLPFTAPAPLTRAFALAIVLLAAAPRPGDAQSLPLTFGGVSAGTVEGSQCGNSVGGGSTGDAQFCSHTSSGGASNESITTSFTNQAEFGGSATATVTFDAGVRYDSNGNVVTRLGPKLGGSASATGGSENIPTTASFSGSMNDAFSLEAGALGNLPGNVILRMSLSGDVLIGPGSQRSYTFGFDGGPAELEGSYSAGNGGTFISPSAGVSFDFVNGEVVMTVSMNLASIGAFNDFFSQGFDIYLEGSVRAEPGETVSLDLNHTLTFDSIGIYDPDGNLIPGLVLTSSSGAYYPFINAFDAGTQPPAGVPVEGGASLLLLGLGALLGRRRRR